MMKHLFSTSAASVALAIGLLAGVSVVGVSSSAEARPDASKTERGEHRQCKVIEQVVTVGDETRKGTVRVCRDLFPWMPIDMDKVAETVGLDANTASVECRVTPTIVDSGKGWSNTLQSASCRRSSAWYVAGSKRPATPPEKSCHPISIAATYPDGNTTTSTITGCASDVGFRLFTDSDGWRCETVRFAIIDAVEGGERVVPVEPVPACNYDGQWEIANDVKRTTVAAALAKWGDMPGMPKPVSAPVNVVGVTADGREVSGQFLTTRKGSPLAVSAKVRSVILDTGHKVALGAQNDGAERVNAAQQDGGETLQDYVAHRVRMVPTTRTTVAVGAHSASTDPHLTSSLAWNGQWILTAN